MKDIAKVFFIAIVLSVAYIGEPLYIIIAGMLAAVILKW